MEKDDNRQDALQLEALLFSREYLYMLAHKLFGGAPDTDLIEALLSDATANVVDEIAGDDATLAGLLGFLGEHHLGFPPGVRRTPAARSFPERAADAIPAARLLS